MKPLKLFFDECCSKKLPVKIQDIYREDYPHIETKHLTDVFTQGKHDDEWIGLLEKDKDWIVITADRGEDPKKPKLPILCADLGITHISFTPALLRNGYSAQKQALLCVWPQIIKIHMLPKGTGISLGYKNMKGGYTPWPHLSIAGKSLDLWCREKAFVFDITKNGEIPGKAAAT